MYVAFFVKKLGFYFISFRASAFAIMSQMKSLTLFKSQETSWRLQYPSYRGRRRCRRRRQLQARRSVAAALPKATATIAAAAETRATSKVDGKSKTRNWSIVSTRFLSQFLSPARSPPPAWSQVLSSTWFENGDKTIAIFAMQPSTLIEQ